MGRDPVLEKFRIGYDPAGLLWTVSVYKAGFDPALIENLLPGTQLAASKTLFLERGSDSAGLIHIWNRHQKQFKDLLNLHDADQVQRYLYKVMSKGVYYIWAYNVVKDSRGGMEIVYIINEKLYLHVIVSNNGYIVTAFPTSNSMSYYDKPRFEYID